MRLLSIGRQSLMAGWVWWTMASEDHVERRRALASLMSKYFLTLKDSPRCEILEWTERRTTSPFYPSGSSSRSVSQRKRFLPLQPQRYLWWNLYELCRHLKPAWYSNKVPTPLRCNNDKLKLRDNSDGNLVNWSLSAWEEEGVNSREESMENVCQGLNSIGYWKLCWIFLLSFAVLWVTL